MRLPVTLINYLPEFLREIREYSQIMNITGYEIEQAERSRRSVLENTFIDDLNELGIERWEKMLNLHPKDTETKADRIFRIKSYMTGDRPYTLIALTKQLEQLCGGSERVSVKLVADKYTLKAEVSLKAKNQMGEVTKVIRKMLPCNMLLDCSLKYNKYNMFKPYTYGQLSEYTNTQLRESALGGN
jgi:hypothetical protein|nr:MAG TPA: tail protein [Caudoviricetes sp.]